MMTDEIDRTDEETLWIEQARKGDKKAFSRLVEAYQRPVYSITYRMLGNPEEAEDAAQEAFLRAYSNLHKYDPKRKFSTWLFSIANHHCIDRLRKRRVTWISIDDNPVLGNMAGNSPQPERHALGPGGARQRSAGAGAARSRTTRCRSCCATGKSAAMRRSPRSWTSASRP